MMKKRMNPTIAKTPAIAPNTVPTRLKAPRAVYIAARWSVKRRKDDAEAENPTERFTHLSLPNIK